MNEPKRILVGVDGKELSFEGGPRFTWVDGKWVITDEDRKAYEEKFRNATIAPVNDEAVDLFTKVAELEADIATLKDMVIRRGKAIDDLLVFLQEAKDRLSLYEARDKFTTQEDAMGGIRIIRKDSQGNILSSMWFSQETWSKLK